MINESANVKITLNGEQAQQELETLQGEMKRLLDLKQKAEKAGDVAGWKQIDNELKKNVKTQNQLKKNYADIENTLRNLNGASLNDLNHAKTALLQKLKSLNQGTKEWVATNNDLKKVKSAISDVGQAMGNVQTPLQKVIGFAKGLLPAFSFLAISAGAKEAFGQIVNSTDTLSTQWAVFTGGLKSGLDEFFRTMATGDFSNFITNMRSAISVGREYEIVLDELEAKQRGLTKAEADARMEMRQLEDIVRNVSLSNEERVAAAEKRIKIEEKLAQQRVDLAKKEYNNELSLATQASKLDEKRLLEQIDAKSVETELHARTLLELRERYAELEKANQVVVGGVRVNGQSTPEMQQLKTEMATYPSFIVEYANNMEKIGNTTDEQLNRLISAYDKVKGAEASALENTKRVRSSMYSIFDEEKRNAKTGNGSGITPTPAAQFTIEQATDDPISNFAIEQAQKEAAILAEKKASEEEWNTFLKKMADERMDITQKELLKDQEKLEFEEQITNARKELQSEYINAIGQVAGALASMFKEGSTAQIAALAVEKAAAIAQIIFQTAVANAKAVAISPLTAGQPWVTINTVSAAASIAGIVATTISSFKDKKNNDKPGYAEGKYPKLQTGMYGDQPHMAIFNEVPGFPEMVIDGLTTRRLQFNYPEIMDAIYRVRDGRQPAYATGKYPDQKTTERIITNNLSNNNLDKIIVKLNDMTKAIKEMKVYASIEDIRKADKNYTEIQNTRGL